MRSVAGVSPNHDVSIRPVLFLGFLAASMPTALLIALWGGTGSAWHGAAAQAVLCGSLAVTSSVIAIWLAQEWKLSGHPALAVLSDGFVGVALIFLTASFMETANHMLVVRVLSMAWTMTFGASSVLFLNWKNLRRVGRQLLGERPFVFHSIQLLVFLLLASIAAALDVPLFHQPAHARAIRLTIFIVAGSAIPVLLISSFRIYLRKRNPVILFFSLGLYLNTLAILGQTAGTEWSLPWWFSQGLGLISVFAIAYGVVEANRVRDRWELIKTLASRSQELQKSHEDLAYSEGRYRSLVNNAPYGIFRLNSSQRFEAVNPALLEILGLPLDGSLRKLPVFTALFRSHQEYETLMQELRHAGRIQDEMFWKRKDGTPVKVRLQCRRVNDGTSIGAIYEGIVEDLSKESSLEEQLRHSQKMEAIGRLAGGIAHDFNNLLTIISGYTGILMDTLADEDPRRADAERVKNATHRAASLTRQLLAFSRKQVLTPTTLNLSAVVSDLSIMLPRLLGEDIDLAFIPGERLASVYADRGQVEQVLMNLIVNARDAMPNGGKITIEVKNERLDRQYSSRRRGVIPGEYVMLAVTDTGCGIDPATQARIFEPFFTTKEEGKGTGLGLATAYGIVKQSGGHIAVYSEPGQGTTFKTYFPASSVTRMSERRQFLPNRVACGETVLVVEDETDLRTMIVRALRRLEYNVIEAGSGEEAMQTVDQANIQVDLLITDVVMPGMRGTQVAQKLSETMPQMKVLFMSGYTDNAMFHQKLLNAGVAFIQKPFTLDVLEEKVARTLETKLGFAAGND